MSIGSAKWDRSKGRPEPIAALNKITERENGEPLVEIHAVAPTVRIVRPSVIPYVRKNVAERLACAAQSLPAGIYLGVIDAFRPLVRQQRIYDFLFDAAVVAYPTRSHASLRRTVCRWVAPTDQPAPPGHCTGAAVDVWLVDEDNEIIDVCSPFDRFGAAPTFSLGLSDAAKQNREILYNCMVSAGFSNCRDEWWHYSYGDAGYAVRMAETECVYGIAHLEPNLYAEQERLFEISMRERVNPFLEPIT